MKMWIASAILFAAVLTTSEALTCYQCVGAEKVPSAISSVIAGLPTLTSLPGAIGLPYCNTSGDTCSTGTMCVKQATKRSVSVGSKVYSQSIYTKGCTTLTTTGGINGVVTIVSGQCYIQTTSTSNGVTTEQLNCYCNNKNDCNGAEMKAISFFVMITGLIASLIV